MTPQEAITRISGLIVSENVFLKVSTMGEIDHSMNIEALEMAKQALEKQIEKKPIIKQSFQRLGREYYACPNPECEDYLGYRYTDELVKTSCCEWCGQALDWGDEE